MSLEKWTVVKSKLGTCQNGTKVFFKSSMFVSLFVCFKGAMGTGACPCPPFAWRTCLYLQKSSQSWEFPLNHYSGLGIQTRSRPCILFVWFIESITFFSILKFISTLEFRMQQVLQINLVGIFISLVKKGNIGRIFCFLDEKKVLERKLSKKNKISIWFIGFLE